MYVKIIHGANMFEKDPKTENPIWKRRWNFEVGASIIPIGILLTYVKTSYISWLYISVYQYQLEQTSPNNRVGIHIKMQWRCPMYPRDWTTPIPSVVFPQFWVHVWWEIKENCIVMDFIIHQPHLRNIAFQIVTIMHMHFNPSKSRSGCYIVASEFENDLWLMLILCFFLYELVLMQIN